MEKVEENEDPRFVGGVWLEGSWPKRGIIKKLRKRGYKNAGRLVENILVEDLNNPDPDVLARIKDGLENHKEDQLGDIGDILQLSDEFTYLDFITHYFPEIIEELKDDCYERILPLPRRSPYVNVFADLDDEYLIKTISRLTLEQINEIYLVYREGNAIIYFLERNFPEFLQDLPAPRSGR
jgi:hypothetical protein